MKRAFGPIGIAYLVLTFAVSAFFLVAGRPIGADAAIAGAPCDHNVCSDTLVVGGQVVDYFYTEHLSPSGEFRIRFRSGPYDTDQFISYMISGFPNFSSWDVLPNTALGAVALPLEDVNPGRTAYERMDNDGCIGCVVDQVMSVRFSGLSPGQYTFDLVVVQYGEQAGRSAMRFWVDLDAPSNMDESEVFNDLSGSGMDLPCSDLDAGDPVDNDLNYLPNCADPNCGGSVGRVNPSTDNCEFPEQTCSDDFDNDGDGSTDCADPDCDGRIGRQSDGALCQYPGEFGLATCGDNFDNDDDGRTDCYDNQGSQSCWKTPAYGCPSSETSCGNNIDDDRDSAYSDAWDDNPLTGKDCEDYDCAGDPNCSSHEHKNVWGEPVEEQCYDGRDNDLDLKIDCRDLDDCFGVWNPADPDKRCLEFEFSQVHEVQYCSNEFDDDGDTSVDCEDGDCNSAFGNCGPCPSREDYNYSACTNAEDDDYDGPVDCRDADCVGANYQRLGTLGSDSAYGHASYCSASENTDMMCGDGFDNDLDGSLDCGDDNCFLRSGPYGETCLPGGEAAPLCDDTWDNDDDGRRDCVDADCFGQDPCAPEDWEDALCIDLPEYSEWTEFTGSDPTIYTRVMTGNHVNDGHKIHLSGRAGYSSVTLIIGDNTDSAKYYPYADAACTVTDAAPGGNAGKFRFTSENGHYIQLFNSAPAVDTFDITVTCPASPEPAEERDLPLSLSALKVPGDIPEYGDLDMTVTLYEDWVPQVIDVEIEGVNFATNEIKVPYGDSIYARVVPNDPGVDLWTSGICSCRARIGTLNFGWSDGDCITGPSPPLFSDMENIGVSGWAEDGADNSTGPVLMGGTYTLNVIPVVEALLTLAPEGEVVGTPPFFTSSDKRVTLKAAFRTATNDAFVSNTCSVYAYRPDGFMVGFGPINTFAGIPGGTNTLLCKSTIDANLPGIDGEYFITIRAQDGDGDIVESNRQVMYLCDTIPAPGELESVCSKADFDRDGAVEGLYTTLYSTAPRQCDNCIGIDNPLQLDNDANGIAEQCEPGEVGRCEVDRHLACHCDSDGTVRVGEVCGILCPGPSIGGDRYADDPPDPLTHTPDYQIIIQKCMEDWGVCLSDGAYCFTDDECTGFGNGGVGWCAGDSQVPCRRDIDCDNGGVDGPCMEADICTDLLVPWLETVYGNLFSGFKMIAPELPPGENLNATYCITAKDTIINFIGGGEGCEREVADLPYELPKSENAFATVLGRIDVEGLLAGDHVPISDVKGDVMSPLDGRVFVWDGAANGDLVIGSGDLGPPHEIRNGNGPHTGAGTIIVNGADLHIQGNIEYNQGPIADLRHLASVAWIVLDDGTGLKGNIYIGRNVTSIAGAFYSDGDFGVYTHDPTPAFMESASDIALEVYGMMIARRFTWTREFRSIDQGSERIIYDGRVVANPPPGFGDLTKLLPQFSDSAF